MNCPTPNPSPTVWERGEVRFNGEDIYYKNADDPGDDQVRAYDLCAAVCADQRPAGLSFSAPWAAYGSDAALDPAGDGRSAQRRDGLQSDRRCRYRPGQSSHRKTPSAGR